MTIARKSLSEMQSRALLAPFGVRFNRAEAAATSDEAAAIASRIGFPVVLKGDHPQLAHKSDVGMVRLGLGREVAVLEAATDMLARLPFDGALSVQETVKGSRELILGFIRDQIFGPCVSIGIGGIMAEAVGDVVFRCAPFDRDEALRAIGDLKGQALLGALRGMPAIDREALAELMLAVAAAGTSRPDIAEIDINPLIVSGDKPIAVDALVIMETRVGESSHA